MFFIIDKYICIWLCEEYNFVELDVLMSVKIKFFIFEIFRIFVVWNKYKLNLWKNIGIMNYGFYNMLLFIDVMFVSYFNI